MAAKCLDQSASDDKPTPSRELGPKTKKRWWTRWGLLVHRSGTGYNDRIIRADGQSKPLKHPRAQREAFVVDGKDSVAIQTGPLFTKLPLEIRQEIFAWVLGNENVRIITVPWRVTAAPDIEGQLSMTQEHFQVDRGCCPRYSARGLPLLQTCRQIYDESIDLLYSTNTFIVYDFASMTTFSRSIPARHLNTIKTLKINYSPITSIPYDHQRTDQYNPPKGESWVDFWKMIAGMKGLKTLHVHLEKYIESLPRAEEGKKAAESEMLQPLMSLRGLVDFCLTLQYVQRDESLDGTAFAPDVRQELAQVVKISRE